MFQNETRSFGLLRFVGVQEIRILYIVPRFNLRQIARFRRWLRHFYTYLQCYVGKVLVMGYLAGGKALPPSHP